MKKKIDKNLIDKLFKISFILFFVISVIGLSIFGFDYLKKNKTKNDLSSVKIDLDCFLDVVCVYTKVQIDGQYMRYRISTFLGREFVKTEYKEIFDLYLESLRDKNSEKYEKLMDKKNLHRSQLYHSVLKESFFNDLIKEFPSSSYIYNLKFENKNEFIIFEKRVMNQNYTRTIFKDNLKSYSGFYFDDYEMIDPEKFKSFESVNLTYYGSDELVETVKNNILLKDDTKKTFPELGLMKFGDQPTKLVNWMTVE